MSAKLNLAVADLLNAVKNRDKVGFALPESRFHKHRRKRDELAARRGIKRRVKPDNARELIAALPAPDDVLHSVLRGDFVLGDALPMLFADHGSCDHLRISTLGLSVKNAEMLRELVRAGKVGRLTLVVSHYFRAVDKTSTFLAVSKLLADVATLKVARCHAKVMVIPTATGNHFVFEGSANLRSSDTIEQLTVFNDRELATFHAEWLDAISPLEP